MKLIIQIPCYNEAESLPITLAELPRHVDGFDKVEWLVIDDGSVDGTFDIAKANGADYIIKLATNSGLAAAFMSGIRAAVSLGADVIVNTDADNQYCAADIQLLIQPILAGAAEFVVGTRPVASMQVPAWKKLFHWIGCQVVKISSGTQILDAPSGFRAFSRNAAVKLQVYNDYTYTLETIIQAGNVGISNTAVPVRINPDLRPSRLISSPQYYILRSAGIIVRSFMLYRSFGLFMLTGVVFTFAGIFILLYPFTAVDGTIRTVIGIASLGAGFVSILAAFIADQIAACRKILEELVSLKRNEPNVLKVD